MVQISRRSFVLAVMVTAATFAMAVAALIRTADAGGGFTDTPPWIATHAEWLQDHGIADGFPDGTFGPNESITRGQTAYWLGNYNDAIRIVERDIITASPDDDFAFSARCSEGERAISGGVDNQTGDFDLMMTDSHPTVDGEAWEVRYETPNDGPTTPGPVTAYAVCVPGPVDAGPG